MTGSSADALLSRWPTRLTTALLFVVVAGVFVGTGHWSVGHVDTVSATLPAWHLATYGNANLDAWYNWPGWPRAVPHGWLVAGHGGHWVSNRMPGVVLIAVPAYWLLGRGGTAPAALPAVLTAALVTAAGIAVLHRVFLRVTSPGLALGGALVAAFATSTWTVSASEMWPHGPDLLWLGATMWALSRRREWLAGVALGAGLLTRPYIAIAAAVIGIGLAIGRRDVRPVLRIGAGSAAALGLLLLWNHHFFSHPTVRGGYESYATSPSGVGGHMWLTNVLGTMGSPTRGVLVYSPFLLALVPGLWRAWRRSPDWIRVSALGGLACLVVELHQNFYSGGTAFYGYRVPLECLTLCAPLFLVSYRESRPAWRRITQGLVVVSAAFTALGAFLFPYPGYPGVEDYSRWEPGYVLSSYPGKSLAVLIGTGVAAAAVTVLLSRRPKPVTDEGPTLDMRIAHARGQLVLD